MTASVTRAHLTAAVQRSSGISHSSAASLVDQIFGVIIEHLERGEDVQIGSFGTFEPRLRGERVGRNPKTGEEVRIAPHMAVNFRPSEVLKREINGL